MSDDKVEKLDKNSLDPNKMLEQIDKEIQKGKAAEIKKKLKEKVEVRNKAKEAYVLAQRDLDDYMEDARDELGILASDV